MNRIVLTLVFALGLTLEAIATTTVLFLGDSLTEGYNLPKEEAFPAVVEKKLKAQGKDVKVVNGGVSGATTASGLKRLDWHLKARPEIMVLALGANDGLRGLKVSDTEKNLTEVIERARTKEIKVILAGMKMPTNMGESYRKEYEAMYHRLAKRFNLKFIPFLLEGVGGVPELNLSDGVHPNTRGHEMMADTVLKVLGPEL